MKRAIAILFLITMLGCADTEQITACTSLCAAHHAALIQTNIDSNDELDFCDCRFNMQEKK